VGCIKKLPEIVFSDGPGPIEVKYLSDHVTLSAPTLSQTEENLTKGSSISIFLQCWNNNWNKNQVVFEIQALCFPFYVVPATTLVPPNLAQAWLHPHSQTHQPLPPFPLPPPKVQPNNPLLLPAPNQQRPHQPPNPLHPHMGTPQIPQVRTSRTIHAHPLQNHSPLHVGHPHPRPLYPTPRP